ncbi:BREX system Lon protease-like protein BrxL [Infirmifilum lucidum]|uniref:BREX system Lon protease-like protein BrxL n=1 Tax=Infirmifilum lucidum TaxID=2776706 RepID=A0A7L9FJF3_9CREN|nr:BREX system Lon protease-like protein BrxL [Infirmifilum lucidum]QOJ79026.1 BREX system Lon protease-like protein BrxL [Infirmifilum lucidum]
MSSDLFAKIRRYFGDYATDKNIASVVELSKLPRFVAEYLATYFSHKYPGDWERRLREFVSEYYYDVGEKELLKSRLVEDKVVRILDELRVWVELGSGEYRGIIRALDVSDAVVPREIANAYPITMVTGAWGLLTLVYDPSKIPRNRRGEALASPIIVSEFKPLQTASADLNVLREARQYFTFEEWVDVLVNTLGLNHEIYSLRQKLLILSRLIPLVEENVNLMEFGPRATGKTYTYRNVSAYTRIIAGGLISPAALIYNLRTGMPGEIAVRDCVVFDEISRVRFQNPDEMMAKLKDYMESSQFERGRQKGSSGCSLVFMGNVEVEKRPEGYVPVEDLTYELPKFMRESAFIDRIHGVLPGWEIPKIGRSKAFLSKGYGIASDYFSEAMHTMRKISYATEIEKYVELQGSITVRDEKSVKKTVSALLKLLFPDEAFDKKELKQVVEIAVEMRQRVRDWLHKLSPEEFPLNTLSFSIRG